MKQFPGQMLATTLIRSLAAQSPALLGSVSPDGNKSNPTSLQERLNLRKDFSAFRFGQRAKDVVAQDNVELSLERRKGHRHIVWVIIEPIRRIDTMTLATAKVQHLVRRAYPNVLEKPTGRRWKSLARNRSQV